jgi:hypothetical protein
MQKGMEFMKTEVEQTVEQRLAERLGFKVCRYQQPNRREVIVIEDGQPVSEDGDLCHAKLWDEVVRLEREHQVMRDALHTSREEILEFVWRDAGCPGEHVAFGNRLAEFSGFQLAELIERWQSFCRYWTQPTPGEEAVRLEREQQVMRRLVDAVWEVYPHIHDAAMEGESAFERAWLKVERVLSEIGEKPIS